MQFYAQKNKQRKADGKREGRVELFLCVSKGTEEPRIYGGRLTIGELG